jgi:hypothetical protein
MEKYLVVEVEFIKVDGRFKKVVDIISDEPTSYYIAGKQLEGSRLRMNVKTLNEELSRGYAVLMEA